MVQPSDEKEDWKRFVPPVSGIAWYKRDAVVLRHGGGCGPGGLRDDITHLSRSSLKRLSFVANNTEVQLVTMITLTYPSVYPTNGKQVKAHLNGFLSAARYRWQPLSYLWWLEFQKRGAPHIHVLTSAPARTEDYQWVAKRWYKIVGSNDEKHLRAGTRTEAIREENGAGKYAATYASKPHQKTVPDEYKHVGRWWGHSRDIPPEPRKVWDFSEEMLNTINPQAAREKWSTLYGYGTRSQEVLQQVIDSAGM